MREPSNLDFDKILDQNSYIPDRELSDTNEDKAKCSLDRGDKAPSGMAWSRSAEHVLVKRIWPMILAIGVLEAVIGVILLCFLVIYMNEYDTLYSTDNSKIISLMSFGGLIALIVSGMILVVSLFLNKRRIMWFYILTSTFLCIYTFVLSVVKIHFALLVLERDTYKITTANREFLLSTACIAGICTLLGSVVHFVGNVTVFTFYNLKYVHPIMFNFGR